MNVNDLYEMSNFGSRTTGLPSDLVLWVRTDPSYHGHNRYRIKITKDRIWSGIFSVGQDSKLLKDINQTHSESEIRAIQGFIQEHYPAIINLIDGKIDTSEFSIYLIKHRGQYCPRRTSSSLLSE